MSGKQPPRFLKAHEIYWLAAAMSLVILPHTVRLPGWIPTMYFLLISWRLLGPLFNWPLPNRDQKLLHWCQNILALMSLLGIFASYHSLVGRDPGVALLVLLAGFKILESHTERDFYVLACLGYVMVTTNFLYTQTIPVALYMTLVTLIFTTCFIVINDLNQRMNIKAQLKLAGSLLIYAMPLMLVLFIFFPRISGPLWRMPQDANTGKTGLSETMSPGSISQLLQSDELAFRVQFLDPPPATGQMYWRGPVFWYTDGKEWHRGWRGELQRDSKPAGARQSLNIKQTGQSIRQNITIEPTEQPWLYGLEMVVKTSRGQISRDLQIVTPKKISRRMRYEVESFPVFTLNDNNEKSLKSALKLPSGFHPRTHELAASWRAKGLDDGQIVDSALSWFRDDEFYYTLQPPLLNGDNVDDFLFESKQGFCEHYASSFVVLMRAAGIPARVITGYQGGSYNVVGDYYNVYQRDAHAWAEVFLEDQGWVRIDPTAAVSPERIEQGIENALPEVISSPLFKVNNSIAYALLRNMRDSWDAINYQWNLWVLGYSASRQLDLLNKIGLGKFGWQALAIGLCIGCSGLMILFAYFIPRGRQKGDPARLLYDRFCKKMSHCGFTRLAHEGPMDFQQRIFLASDTLASATYDITRCYIDVRYGSNKKQLAELKTLVSRFNPEKTQDR